MTLLEAVITPRLHSQLIPNVVFVENSTLFHHQPRIVASEEIADYLTTLGHHNVTFDHGGVGVTQYVAIETTLEPIVASSVVSSSSSSLLAAADVITTSSNKKKYKVQQLIQGVSDPRKDGIPAAAEL